MNITPMHTCTARKHTLSEFAREEKAKQESIRQDSSVERKDSVQSPDLQMIKKQRIRQDEEYHPAITSRHLSNDKKDWSLALSYSGGEKRTDTRRTMIPGSIASDKPQEVIKELHYHLSITLSLSLCKKFDERKGIETGLQYTHLRSDFTTVTNYSLNEAQKIDYIGIPIKGIFNIRNGRRWSIYISAGVTMDIPLRATSEKSVFDESGQITSQTRGNIYPSLQWSANFGIGFQYRIIPSLGVYAEPKLYYFFKINMIYLSATCVHVLQI